MNLIPKRPKPDKTKVERSVIKILLLRMRYVLLRKEP